jgi:ribonuclease HI
MLSFGQYRNQLLKDVYPKDPQYLKWLQTQPWFRIKYSDLYTENSSLLIKYKKPIEINNNTFLIYTDGACSNNGLQNPKAGSGVYFSPNNRVTIDDISFKLTMENPTNNKAELIAIEKALDACCIHNIKEQIVIFTDSNYSRKCITLWYPNWVKKNELKGKKNLDILERISILNEKLNPTFEYIKAHTELQDEHSLGNKEADRLAVQASK